MLVATLSPIKLGGLRASRKGRRAKAGREKRSKKRGVMVKECTICEKSQSSYKCPKCLSHYCSLLCFKKHKRECPVFQKLKQESDADKGSSGTAVSERNSAQLEKGNIRKKKEAELPKHLKLRLSGSKWLTNILSSKKLKRQLESIDSAPDREQSLKKMRENSNFENEFVGPLLDILKS